jgi:coproporphyrinogen III oxidase
MNARRLFETFDFKDVPGQWWFGGGTDITPCYVDEEDMRHFHGVYKASVAGFVLDFELSLEAISKRDRFQ